MKLVSLMGTVSKQVNTTVRGHGYPWR